MNGDLNIIVRDRCRDRYVWIFTDDQATEVLRSLGRFASNHDLNFTWWDVAVLAKRVREMVATETGSARGGILG